MANLALSVTNKVNPISGAGGAHEQQSFEASEQINPGQIFRIDTTTGKAVKATGDTLANAGQVTAAGTFVSELFIAIDGARQAGNTVTGMKKGLLDGFDLTALAYGAPVYISATAGTLADTAATISTIVGRVRPAAYVGTPSGADKILAVACPPYN